LVLSHHFHAIEIPGAPKSQVSSEKSGHKECHLPKTEASAHNNPDSVSSPNQFELLQPPEETWTFNHQPTVNIPGSLKSLESEKGGNPLNNLKIGEEEKQPGPPKTFIFKSMIRGYTSRINRTELEDILLKSKAAREPDKEASQTPQNPEIGIAMPHPKAILVGILENFEAERREEINDYFTRMKDLQANITKDRTNQKDRDKELASCNIQLCETNVSLGAIRPKLQYLASSIAMLESCSGTPDLIGDLSFDCSQQAENLIGKLWTAQLSEVKIRLQQLKGKCDKCKIDVETLQYRLTGNLLVVSSPKISVLIWPC
jgi:hypothetical protein